MSTKTWSVIASSIFVFILSLISLVDQSFAESRNIDDLLRRRQSLVVSLEGQIQDYERSERSKPKAAKSTVLETAKGLYRTALLVPNVVEAVISRKVSREKLIITVKGVHDASQAFTESYRSAQRFKMLDRQQEEAVGYAVRISKKIVQIDQQIAKLYSEQADARETLAPESNQLGKWALVSTVSQMPGEQAVAMPGNELEIGICNEEIEKNSEGYQKLIPLDGWYDRNNEGPFRNCAKTTFKVTGLLSIEGVMRCTDASLVGRVKDSGDVIEASIAIISDGKVSQVITDTYKKCE